MAADRSWLRANLRDQNTFRQVVTALFKRQVIFSLVLFCTIGIYIVKEYCGVKVLAQLREDDLLCSIRSLPLYPHLSK